MTGNIIKLWQKSSQSSLPTLLFVVFSLLLAYQLAQFTWYWLAPPWQSDVYVPSNTPNTHTASSATSDTEAVARYHLFGEPQQQVIEVAKPISAPETKLKLELRGVVATGDEFGAAIIADASRNEGYYRVGDDLPGNVKLHEVFADKVILDRNGLFETLSLPSERMETTGLSPSTGMQTLGGHVASAETGPLLREYRELLQTDPQQLMGLVRTFPVRRGNKLIGYRIAPGRDRSLLAKFGLRPGDVVTGVNGISLDSPANGLAVMQKLNSAQRLTLEVERNGSKQSFEFSLN